VRHVRIPVSSPVALDRRKGPRRRPLLAAAATAASLSLLGMACGLSSGGGARPTTPSVAVESSAAQLAIWPADGVLDADPGNGISVSVARGTITNVAVRTPADPVQGRLARGDRRWHSVWALNTNARYTVVATAVDREGRTVTARSTFRTLDPARTFDTHIFQGYRKTYGVGMPVILTFNRPIVRKVAVERSLELWTSKPVVGAWYWEGDQTLYFRPQRYWPDHTKVRFVGHLDGLEGAPGVYGTHTLTQRFEIGRSLIAVANTVTHRVRIYLDRRLFGDWPMSAGRPGDDTPNGTYLTMDKSNPERMVGPGYDIEVPWSVRFTNSGNFLHDAYWSVGDQGFENVSHGCVNLSPEHAETYYKLATQGDPVTITGSPTAGTWGDGWTVWFLTFEQLVRGSALHQAVRAGPHGSVFVDPDTLPPLRAKPPLGRPRPGNANQA
jgi:lipoprotein-anchoring transpeptidase ErfK/SrfK